MLYDVATLTVRVVPRSSRAGVERRGEEIVVRVTSPTEGGRATEEARRRVAAALGVARSTVTLRTGARSRTKAFDVAGLTDPQLTARIGAIPATPEH